MNKTTSDIKPLIDYFLHLFTIQVLGPARKPEIAEAVCISDKTTASSVYELRLKAGKTEKYRRMSILPIGERVESKSMCFSVIYDEPLVIKIPPQPITELKPYLEHIELEHSIATRLTPKIACIYPMLQTILKKLPFVKLPEGLTPEETEKACIAELKKKPGVQQYLKINKGFVYFMELSRHGFFNHIIESMHLVKERMRSNILLSMPEAFSDLHTFESIYGRDSAPVYLDLCRLYAEFENKIDSLAGKHGGTSVAPYQRRHWFFSRLAGLQPETETDELPDGLAEKLKELTDQLINSNQTSVENLYKAVRSRVQQKNFETNRLRIKGLIVNVLELLYRLNKAGVVIRDLKPDNMFIDRYLDGAEHIPANPSTYGLGLIDLETAAGLNSEKNLPQPLLAGTPPYATPSHIFPNSVLTRLYGPSTTRVFYLQDWYASVGIIFHIITGRILFAKTARLMPEIIRARKTTGKNAGQVVQMYTNVSGKFWKTAIAEFMEKIKMYRSRIADMDFVFPVHIRTFLAESGISEKERIEKEINSQLKIYPSLERRMPQILNASPEEIHKSIRRQILMGRRPDARTADALQALYRIAHSKYRLAHLNKAIKKLDAQPDCCFVLSYMLDRVFYTMHMPQWSGYPYEQKGPCFALYPPQKSKNLKF